MTATRSQSCPMTPRSWLMNRTPIPVSSRRVRNSSRICACTVTSSAVVGSSATSRVGPAATAMAITTRWR
ncbi:hypothetical protein BWO91_11340 [Plantibacter flavus]|nr:hypothetical protein BWO91_11340 [Plantibacter flavus]